MISKELLSEVLKDKLKEEYNGSYDFICNGVVNLERNEVSSTLGFYDSELDFFINIYELAYKCKEWAFYTYKISVSSFKSGSFCLKEFNQIKDNSEYWVELDTASIDCEINIDDSGIFKSCSEPEAIFKACQWILDNKEIK